MNTNTPRAGGAIQNEQFWGIVCDYKQIPWEWTPTPLDQKYLNRNVARWFKLLLPLDNIYQNCRISGMKENLKFKFKI